MTRIGQSSMQNVNIVIFILETEFMTHIYSFPEPTIVLAVAELALEASEGKKLKTLIVITLIMISKCQSSIGSNEYYVPN